MIRLATKSRAEHLAWALLAGADSWADKLELQPSPRDMTSYHLHQLEMVTTWSTSTVTKLQ